MASSALETVAEPVPIPTSPSMRTFLERAAALHSRAAAILRANRMHSEAARADQFAARIRLTLDEPKETRRMHALAEAVRDSPDTSVLFKRALEGALALIGGDRGNIQTRELTNGSLRIAAQCGFDSEFLEYFAIVEDDTSACGRAATARSQTVIIDVREDPAFEPHREIAAASRFRAVQSTPLVDPTGRVRGVISTHYRHPHRPGSRDLQLIQWYAERVGAALGNRPDHATAVHEATAALQAKTADLHGGAAARINHSAWAMLTNGNRPKALEARERARRAVERARQERERAQALARRARTERAPPVSATVSIVSYRP